MLVQMFQIKCDTCFQRVPSIPSEDLQSVVTQARADGWEIVDGLELCPRHVALAKCNKTSHRWGEVRPAITIDGFTSYPYRGCVNGCGSGEEFVNGEWVPFTGQYRTSEEAELSE